MNNIKLFIDTKGLPLDEWRKLFSELYGLIDGVKVHSSFDQFGFPRVRAQVPKTLEFFSDVKISEVPEVIRERGAIYARGSNFITVNPSGSSAFKAAAELEKMEGSQTRIVIVTELTSSEDALPDLKAKIIAKAERTVRHNMSAITCPGPAIPAIRKHGDPRIRDLFLVVPAIRPADIPRQNDGQNWISTPEQVHDWAEGRNYMCVAGSAVVDAPKYGISRLEAIRMFRKPYSSAL